MYEIPDDFQVFVKPVGAVCNLSCKYCYYLEKKDLFQGEKSFRMNEDVLEQYISQHIKASKSDFISFSWHGGEPTMAGLDYFKKIVAIQKNQKPVGTKIINGIQTNGTLLNESWCRFFAKENFVVGVSLDGPDYLNNKYRKTKDGSTVFQKILNGYNLLQKYNVPFEILCVVNDKNVKYPLEVYQFFKTLNVQYLTFLPLVIPDKKIIVSDSSVPPKDFGIFLSKIFDEWVENDIGKIKIQIIEEAIRIAFKQDHTLCIFKKTCGRVPVIEFNGDFFSCDHYVTPDYHIGNIMEQSISELLNSKKQKEFGEVKRNTLPDYCLRCEVLNMCNGGCPKNRLIKTPDEQSGLNYLCEGYKYFFNHCRPFVETVAKVWEHQ